MHNYQPFDATLLDSAGLNRQAVFNMDALPADLAASVRSFCAADQPYRQLILIGNTGKALWESVKAAGIASEHPIDAFTTRTITRWFAEHNPHTACELIYPSEHLIGLQRLGQLAGWHHASPLMVGIDTEWGTWFAYRAVLLADSMYEASKPLEGEHACHSCRHKNCLSNCPAGALDSGQLDLQKCIGYRKQADSKCKATCLARVSCPVGSMHRYSDEQIRHIYSLSMRAIERHY